MSKSLWSMTGAILGGLGIAVLFGAFSTFALIRTPEKTELSQASGQVAGMEPGRGRARSTNYLVVEANGRVIRLAIHACEHQIASLQKGVTVTVLHDDKTLFEIAANGQVLCSYEATARALGQARGDNLRFTLAVAAGGAALVLLALWSRWRTGRQLTHLRAAMRHREGEGPKQ